MPEYKNHPFEDLALFRNPPENADTVSFLNAFHRCYEEVIPEKIQILSEYSFARLINRIESLGSNISRDNHLNSKKLQKDLRKFAQRLKELEPKLVDNRDFLSNASIDYHLKRGELKENDNPTANSPLYLWTNDFASVDPEDGIVTFKEHIRRLKTSLQVLDEVLGIEIEHTRQPVGRKEGISLDMYLARTAVLSHIFLSLQPKITNNGTDPFYLIILKALELVRERKIETEIDSDPNISRYLKPIFHDPDIITRVKFIYEEYDRPDLYQEYMKKTKLKN